MPELKASVPAARPLSAQQTALMLLGIASVFWAQFAWVRATNFSGYDEWLYMSLASRGIIGFPHANRPFVLLWHVLPAMVLPNSWTSYFFAHAAYLILSGWLVYALCRRLAPGEPVLALLAGIVSVTWAPMDHARLDSVGLAGYAGWTFAVLLTIVMFVDAWRAGSWLRLALTSSLAIVVARGTEACIPILLGMPLVLLWWFGAGSRRLWTWVGLWEGVVIVSVFPALLPRGGLGQLAELPDYQSALRFDPAPLRVLARLLRQFGFHLLPLVSTPLKELSEAAVTVGVGVFALVYLSAVRFVGEGAIEVTVRRSVLRLGGLGLAFATLGYAAFALSAAVVTPVRTQFLAAPGIAILLASGAHLMASGFPKSRRTLALGLMGAWIVAVGAGRTVAMQRDWDRWGSFPGQNRLLRQLTEQVPDVVPNTLIVLIDETRVFPATFTFRHAIEYLYRGRAIGFVSGAYEFLYPSFFTSQGIRSEPWPVIRKVWRSAPTFHRYDEVVVVWYGTEHRLSVLEAWPVGALPPLPPGTTYEPGARILRGQVSIPQRAVLKGEP